MKNVFVQVTGLMIEKGETVAYQKWVNMSRVQEIDPPSALAEDQHLPKGAGAVLTMNIPDCSVVTRELPEQILAKLAEVNREPVDGKPPRVPGMIPTFQVRELLEREHKETQETYNMVSEDRLRLKLMGRIELLEALMKRKELQ